MLLALEMLASRDESEQSALLVMASFPSEDELVWLFESEPELQFPDERWPISAATWTTTRDGITVDCNIAPFESSVHIWCRQGEHAIAELRLLYTVDLVTIDRTHGQEALVVFCSQDARLAPVRLQLRPCISLIASTEPKPPT